MKIGIVGQGAIGSLFTYYWQQYRPVLLLKDVPSPAKTLIDLSGNPHLLNNSQCLITNPSEVSYEAIIIAVKGYQLPTVINNLASWLPISTKIVLVQNGMGGADLLAKHFTHNPLFVGTTTDAVYATDTRHYNITAMGCLDIGRYIHSPIDQQQNNHDKLNNRNVEAWAHSFFSCHPQSHFQQDILFALYRKLAINAVINPLTSVLNIKNGDLVNYPNEVSCIKAEVFAIYNAMQIAYSPAVLSSTIDNVIANTSNNYSSMYQDVHFARQTEIDSILGYLLKQAKILHLSVPFMNKLYTQISAIDKAAVKG